MKPSEKQIAEFCFLTMFEPHKVYEKHFQTLKQNYKDEHILQIVSFVSILVAESIGDKLTNSISDE